MTGLDITREVITEVLVVFDVALVLFVARHLWSQVRELGWFGMRARLGNRAAASIAVHDIGLGLLRAWTIYQFVWWQEHGTIVDLEQLFPVGLVGLAICVWGMGCQIKIFSPAKWGHWGWVLTAMAALSFVGYMHSR